MRVIRISTITCLLCLLATPCILALGEKNAADITPYFLGFEPWGAEVLAYDPVSPQNDPTHFDLIPMDRESGEISENTKLFSRVPETFNSIELSETRDTVPKENWRFSILYTMKAQNDRSNRCFKLDFFDYSNAAWLTIVDLVNEHETVLYDNPVMLSENSTQAFEDVYIERVAKLRTKSITE